MKYEIGTVVLVGTTDTKMIGTIVRYEVHRYPYVVQLVNGNECILDADDVNFCIKQLADAMDNSKEISK